MIPALAATLLLFGGCTPAGRREAAFDPDSIPSAYARASAALMWPGATRAFWITPRGDLFNGEWSVRVRASSAGREADVPRVIAYEERWRPVAHWRRDDGAVRWEFEAVAFPEPAPRDSGLLVSLEASASNRSERPCEARLAVRLAPADSLPLFRVFDAADPPLGVLRWARAGDDTAEGWSDLGGAGDSSVASWTLRPHETRRARFLLPAYPARARRLASWGGTPHARRAGDARRYWEAELARGTRFDLGDPEVERALAAAQVVLLSCRERRGPLWVPIGGPFHYRDVWLRDGARVIRALAVSGHTRAARELAEGFTMLQWPQGAFLSQRGQLDGTGQALWAFEQALLRGGPDTSVARYASLAEHAWRWCEWQRDLGCKSGWPFGTMLPFGDPRDAELVRAQLVGNDAWTLAGYRAAARLLRAANRAAAAESVEVTLARYRADFEHALAISRHPDLPPSWQLVGRDWGNLATAYPCGALSPEHPRCVALARRVWAAAGGAGLAWYGTPDSLHYYLGADLGTWALLTGRRTQADSVLEALLQWRDASGAAGEIFTRSGRDFGINLPPHATSAAVLIDLVRNALVFDDGDTLQLTLGARERWWTHGSVRGAPTRRGTIDLEFERRGEAAEWRWTPVDVWTALTLPPGTRLAGEIGAPLRAGPGGTVVLAPPGTREAHVPLADAEPARP